MKDTVRVRFAPSPTGPLHLGGLRTALYNYLFAKKHNGSFILRIEDTDQTRLVKGAEDYINNALKWSGLIPDEGIENGGNYGPYRQSDRRDIYKQHIEKLIALKRAYYAFDTKEALDEMRNRGQDNYSAKYDQKTRLQMKNSLTIGFDEAKKMVEDGVPHTVRMLVPEDRVITFEDEVRGQVRFQSKELDDKVIMKEDGLPTYHLANVVDDKLMEISHVIRGEEWLSSTAHHVLLYEAFDWQNQMPIFAHLPLILKPTGKGKLSKRDGQKFGFPVFPLSWKDNDESLEGFDTFGFDPQAMLNFVALLGWNPGTEQEIFSLDQLVDSFSLDHIGKSGARFDYTKARWFNAQYLKEQDNQLYLDRVLPFLEKEGIEVENKKLAEVIRLMKDRVQTYQEFPAETYYFFQPVKWYNQKILRKKWKPEVKGFFMDVSSLLVQHPKFEGPELKEIVSEFINAHDCSFGDILPLLRLALSGDTKGPDVFEMMAVLGRGNTRHRLFHAEDEFGSQLDQSGNSPGT